MYLRYGHVYNDIVLTLAIRIDDRCVWIQDGCLPRGAFGRFVNIRKLLFRKDNILIGSVGPIYFNKIFTMLHPWTSVDICNLDTINFLIDERSLRFVVFFLKHRGKNHNK